jgi:hypothetical protein
VVPPKQQKQFAPSGNRTQGSTMATLNFTTKPMVRFFKLAVFWDLKNGKKKKDTEDGQTVLCACPTHQSFFITLVT